MNALKKVWDMVCRNPGPVIKIIAVQLVSAAALGMISGIGSCILPGFLHTLWQLIMGGADLLFGLICASSSLYLLSEQIIQNRKMTLSENFSEFYTWFFAHWKQVWKPYLIWDILAMLAVSIGSGVVTFMLVLAFLAAAGGGIFAYMSTEISLLYQIFGILRSLTQAGWLLVILCVVLLIFSAGISLLLSAVSYRGMYALAAGWKKKILIRSVMGRCLSMAVIPAIAAIAVSGVLLILVGISVFVFESLLPLLLVIPVALLLLILLVMYQYAARVRVLLDLDNGSIAENQFSDQPGTAAD